MKQRPHRAAPRRQHLYDGRNYIGAINQQRDGWHVLDVKGRDLGAFLNKRAAIAFLAKAKRGVA